MISHWTATLNKIILSNSFIGCEVFCGDLYQLKEEEVCGMIYRSGAFILLEADYTAFDYFVLAVLVESSNGRYRWKSVPVVHVYRTEGNEKLDIEEIYTENLEEDDDPTLSDIEYCVSQCDTLNERPKKRFRGGPL